MMHCNNCRYSSVQSVHNVYTNTETDSGIQSDLNGIITDFSNSKSAAEISQMTQYHIRTSA